MKKLIFSLCLLLSFSAVAEPHHGHHHSHHSDSRWSFGFYVAPPPSVFYPVFPPVTVYQTPPPMPVYPVQPAPVYSPSYQGMEPGYWYYCSELQAYYPRVSSCPTDWKKIAPR